MRLGTNIGSWVMLAATMLGAGCREEIGHGPNPCNAATCDILEEDCQEKVMAVIRCFRGGDEDVMPDVEVITEDEYIELVTGDEITEEERTIYTRFARGMSLFQLSPEMPDLESDVAEYASQIAAAYLTEGKRVVLIDRDEPLDSRAAFATFAHELVHALQDREIGLEEFYENVRPTVDGTLAARALIEGEGTHYDMLTYAALAGAHPSHINWGYEYASYQIDMLLAGYEDESPLVLSAVRFPYAFGGDYVSDTWLFGGQAAVADLFEEPPLSTYDVLTFSAPSDDRRDDIEAFREASRLAPIDGYELVAYDELGSFVLDGFLHRLELTEDELLDHRVLWLVADGTTVLHHAEDDHVVAAWRMQFQSGKTPDEETISLWREALGAPDEAAPEPSDDVMARVYVDDDDVILIASDAPLDAAFLGDELTWEPALDDNEMTELPTAAKHCRGRRCTF
jgi:hypothetical protein